MRPHYMTPDMYFASKCVALYEPDIYVVSMYVTLYVFALLYVFVIGY